MLDGLATQGGSLAYRVFGQSAVYVTAGGSTSLVTVIGQRESDVVPDGTFSTAVEEQLVFQVRQSEVAQPGRGDALTVAGLDYLVQRYEVADVLGKEWALSVRAVRGAA